MKAPKLCARVSLKGSDAQGFVTAHHDGRVKVLWPTYSSSWHSPAELVAVHSKGARPRSDGASADRNGCGVLGQVQSEQP